MAFFNNKRKVNPSSSFPTDCFTNGSEVGCTTCYDKEIRGEVLAFDQTTKLLVLKCPASNGQPSLSNVSVVNLGLVKDIVVYADKFGESSLDPLNLPLLNSRLKRHIDEKRRYIQAMAGGVSSEGQNLFLTISKTIREVTWKGHNLIVFNQVKITPPYRPENIEGSPDSKAYIHIKKVAPMWPLDCEWLNKTEKWKLYFNNECVIVCQVEKHFWDLENPSKKIQNTNENETINNNGNSSNQVNGVQNTAAASQ